MKTAPLLTPSGGRRAPGARGRSASPPGRMLALYFPDLACELAALERESAGGPGEAPGHLLGVVLAGDDEAVTPASLLHGATAQARRRGVAPGQRVAEALALAPGLEVRKLAPARIDEALLRFAEVALRVSHHLAVVPPDGLLIELPRELVHPDGEGEAAVFLCERARTLGHRVRASVASGPSAGLVARLGTASCVILEPGREAEALASLSPRPRFPQRTSPLPLHTPLHPLTESLAWADGPRSADALLRSLRILLDRVSARLEGRRECAAQVSLRYEGAAGPPRALDVPFPRPLWRAADLAHMLWPHVERLPLPLRRLSLEVSRFVRHAIALSPAPPPPPPLLAELTSELGEARVGVLTPDPSDPLPPTRWLDPPVPVEGKLARGARVDIDRQTFVVQRVAPIAPPLPSSRPSPREDLLVWLSHGDSCIQAWIVREPEGQRAFLHGWFT